MPRKNSIISCTNKSCKNKTRNPKYCSVSCTNIDKPKRQMKKSYCKACNADVTPAKYCNSYRTMCNKCLKNKQRKTKKHHDYTTVKELKRELGRGYSLRITTKSRRKYIRSKHSKKCYLCGYSKHVDVCHIKPVASFSDTDMIGKINDLKNLVALCKNHHWELDQNLLDKKDEKRISKINPYGCGEARENRTLILGVTSLRSNC